MRSLAGSLIKVGILETLAFRLKPLMDLSAYPVIMLANYCLYSAIFANSEMVAGYTVAQAITYMGIAWMLRSAFKTQTDRLIGNRVRSGDIALDLMRPIYYPSLVFWQGLGRSLGRALFISVPLVVFSAVFLDVSAPKNLRTWAFFAASVAIGYLMAFSIDLLVGVAAFFVEYNVELSWTVDMTVRLLAGLLIPLDFFPERIAAILLHSPFRYIYFLPIQIYLGRISSEEIIPALMTGTLWLIGMLIAGHVLYLIGTRRLTIQGG
ncbi:MAG TPA: ABC-2 family transporter protein [bacterium]|nr:ABC-2 family transporter protein [bacterium]